jgi:hypothetical protein
MAHFKMVGYTTTRLHGYTATLWQRFDDNRTSFYRSNP